MDTAHGVANVADNYFVLVHDVDMADLNYLL